MLEFGKKINYRPLIVSLLIGAFVFALTQIISFIGSLIFGIGLFFLVFLGYYWNIMPMTFSYWKFDGKTIEYSDMSSAGNRLLMLLTPLINHLKKIDVSSIKSVTITGDLDNLKEMPFAVPYSAYLGIMSATISMARNPVDLNVELIDGSKIDLNITRDFVYNHDETLKKLDKILDDLNANNIQVINKTNHDVKLSF